MNATTESGCGRLTEDECHDVAEAYLCKVIGQTTTDVCWDQRHHMQGHLQVGEHELVVIAPRDTQHEPIVLTAEDWDAVRHASGEQAATIVRECAIHDHDELVAVFG